MADYQITAIIPKEKRRVLIQFDNGMQLTLYRSEIRSLSNEAQTLLLTEGAEIPECLYQKILNGIVGIRAKKRVLYMLEKMDRTEIQLREKMQQNGYPKECIDAAISYAKSFHYIDDLRYAKTYVRYQQQKKSRQRLRTDLMKKGVAKQLIEQALEEEFVSDERRKILELLEKKRYDCTTKDRKEQQRMYQFLLRRGYKSSDILGVMRCASDYE